MPELVTHRKKNREVKDSRQIFQLRQSQITALGRMRRGWRDNQATTLDGTAWRKLAHPHVQNKPTAHNSSRVPRYQIRGLYFSLTDTFGTTVRRECPLSLLVVRA